MALRTEVPMGAPNAARITEARRLADRVADLEKLSGQLREQVQRIGELALGQEPQDYEIVDKPGPAHGVIPQATVNLGGVVDRLQGTIENARTILQELGERPEKEPF